MNYKLQKEVKKNMEREIMQYDYNKKKLENLKNNLSTASTRKLLYLEERIHYVEEAYSKLKQEEKEIYNIIFKKKCNWLYCQTIYNIDKDTYYNIYNKSLYYLAQEWGEI